MAKKIISIMMTIILMTSTSYGNVINLWELGQKVVIVTVQIAESPTSKAVASTVTALLGIAVISDAVTKHRGEWHVPVRVPSSSIEYIQNKVNTGVKEASECYIEVITQPQYRIFDSQWSDKDNMAKHACGHNFKYPINYLEATASTYTVVVSKADFKNKWLLQNGRYNIYRDGRVLVVSRNGRLISSFNSQPKGRVVAGGVMTKKFRLALGWAI